jgi:hypothetical protein
LRLALASNRLVCRRMRGANRCNGAFGGIGGGRLDERDLAVGARAARRPAPHPNRPETQCLERGFIERHQTPSFENV